MLSIYRTLRHLATITLFFTAVVCVQAQNSPLNVEEQTKAAQAGDANAMNRLGLAYFRGTAPVEKDTKQAYEWFKKAADKGHANGQYSLGYFTENGINTSKNLEEAKVWYQKAADQGHPGAKKRLEDLQALAATKGTNAPSMPAATSNAATPIPSAPARTTPVAASPAASNMPVDCNARPGKGVNYAGCQFAKREFENVDLEGANFQGAMLSRARFSNVNLNRSNFSNSDVTFVKFENAKMNNIIFKNVKRNGDTNFSKVELQNADFTGTSLTYTILEGVDLRGANLSGLNIRNSNLHKANLTGANLAGSDLSNTWIEAANLSSANFEGANLTKANLKGVTPANTRWSNTNLGSAIWIDGSRCNDFATDTCEKGAASAPTRDFYGAVDVTGPYWFKASDALIGQDSAQGKVLQGILLKLDKAANEHAALTDIRQYDRAAVYKAQMQQFASEFVRAWGQGDASFKAKYVSKNGGYFALYPSKENYSAWVIFGKSGELRQVAAQTPRVLSAGPYVIHGYDGQGGVPLR